MSDTQTGRPATAGSGAVPPRAPASIVVPAHDEANVVGACLDALAADPVARACEVVVVANGCADDTAEVARAFARSLPRLQVVELEEASKIAALNAGDAATRTFPRVYLDADVVIGEGAMSELVTSLTTEEPVVASPSVCFDVTRSPRLVKAFYEVYEQLPYVRDGLVGLGVYGVSEAGRRRFPRFPDVIADDLFVQRCFRPGERLTTQGSFTVRVPRTTRDLVQVRRRSAGGARQLLARGDEVATVETVSTSAGTLSSLARLVLERPRLLAAALVYLAIGVASRVRPVADASSWTRDESTRLVLDTAEPRIVHLDGLPIWSATQVDVVDHVMGRLELGQGGIIATPNVDILRQDSRAARTVLDKVDLLVPDGMPLLWASRLQGEPLRSRIAGSDLVWALSGAAAARGRSVFLLGGAPGVAARAASAFRVLTPGLVVAGTAAPPRGFESSAAEMEALRSELLRTQPDLVFVALGNPRQEELALRLREDLPQTWFLGCGGSFDMAAGDQVRAPAALQRLGLEWVHRLRLEPGRLWRRYLVNDVPYALGMMRRAVWRRWRR